MKLYKRIDMPKSRKPLPVYLQIRDTSGAYHQAAARISRAINGQCNYSAGIAHALSFTDSYYKRMDKPIDYASADIPLLEDYIIHGYDYTIRQAAFHEWRRRKMEGVE
jgi:hypothetical protein